MKTKLITLVAALLLPLSLSAQQWDYEYLFDLSIKGSETIYDLKFKSRGQHKTAELTLKNVAGKAVVTLDDEKPTITVTGQTHSLDVFLGSHAESFLKDHHYQWLENLLTDWLEKYCKH